MKTKILIAILFCLVIVCLIKINSKDEKIDFSSLPLSEQNLYVLKDEVKKFQNYIVPKSYLDSNSTLIEDNLILARRNIDILFSLKPKDLIKIFDSKDNNISDVKLNHSKDKDFLEYKKMIMENLQRFDSQISILNNDLNKERALLLKNKQELKNQEDYYKGEIDRLHDNFVILQNNFENEILILKNKLKEKEENTNNTISDNNATKVKKSKFSNEKRISVLEKEIENRLLIQDKLENENANLRKKIEQKSKAETLSKLVFIDQVSCDSLPLKKTIDGLCRNRVLEFLHKYNSNFIFEIVPIIDQRGYAFDYEIAKRIDPKDLKRINEYVNQGVGKERAKLAANLIKDEFGDFARITFSPDVIIKNDSRGFIVKAFK